jgi:hypothetical protein
MENLTTPAAAGPAADPQAYIAGLIDRASDPSLPISGRNKIVDQIEAYHRNGGIPPMGQTPVDRPQAYAGSAPAADPTVADQPEPGFEPAPSPGHYALEQALPPTVGVEDQGALDALKSNLHDMGVPAPLAASAISEIATLHDQGLLHDVTTSDRAFVRRNDMLAKAHGADGFKVIAADGTAYLDRQVKAGKLTEAYADAIAASPMALTHAAMIARHGKR